MWTIFLPWKRELIKQAEGDFVKTDKEQRVPAANHRSIVTLDPDSVVEMRGPERPDRRRSPPRRGDDRRFPGPPGGRHPDRRRQRSPSPPGDRFRRSPPPFKRYRREDEQLDRYGRGFPGEPPNDRRGGPYRDRYEEDMRFRGDPYDRRTPSPPAPRRPLTYKEFMATLHDDVTPEQAQREYQEYLKSVWGSAVRAEFEATKNDTAVRNKYDPRAFQKNLKRRNELAAEAAKVFAEDLAGGALDPKAEDFNQGAGPAVETNGAANGNGAEGNGLEDEAAQPRQPQPPNAPEVCWKEQRVKEDIALSRDLVRKLDEEKGIADNPLLRHAPAPAADGKAEGEEGEKEKDKDEAMPDAVEGNYEELLGKLDLQLAYLWRVHSVDYYRGAEIIDPLDLDARGPNKLRTLRGPRPEEGEQAEEAEEKKGLKELERRVTAVWKKRLRENDKFEAMIQKERVEAAITDWVEEQIKHIEDNKWGNTLSTKLFVAKEFVVKHIRLKHSHVVDAEREKIYDEIFWENFRKDKEEEEARRQRQEALRMQQHLNPLMAMAPMGMAPLAGPVPMYDGPEMGYGEFEGEPFMDQIGPDNFMLGRNNSMRGRGGSGPRSGGRGGGPGRGMAAGGRGGVALLDGIAAGGPGPMMPGPLPGQMLVLAPGAGPFGPFVAVDVPPGDMGGPPMPPMVPPRGRGGRGPPQGPVRGGGRGGRGFGGPMFMGPPGAKLDRNGVREYYDLDAPENQRSVLDYGDL
ncbi:hypothetical protein WJX72_008084 [[Myrmecia] bisecta]|uniref:Uncharacterized protein n=1 Tax=[Myrmecia] bisecta TaxID=41462 RepID=A0AAW1P8I1_9CHLO